MHKKLQSIARISFTILLLLALCSCADKSMDIHALATSLPTAEPLTESQVIRLTLESQYLGRETPFMVYLPKGYGGGYDYPVLYGLHGYSSNEKAWIDTIGAAEAADKLIDTDEIEPLIMVFPLTRYDTIKEIQADLDDDGKLGEGKMDQFICTELVPYIDSHYDTITSADGRYIGGFSMGGAIALRTAFHHTDMFSKVGGYTPAVAYSDFSDKQLEKWLFPNDDIDNIDDVAAFAKEKGLDKLHVYINYGNVNDPFSAGVQSLYDALQKRGVSVELEIYDGGHDVHIVIDSLEEHLKFYCRKD